MLTVESSQEPPNLPLKVDGYILGKYDLVQQATVERSSFFLSAESE